ncbi:50S ribosomal protein L9 [Candidatus Aerophobetes bacterium]|uniref:Large ribosomal subunit protein bL9 n=1 Tax=Aerophobetes bacterium TaxID=2030807 RepID=A0A2A4YIZ1_UNCAE|nr:MAG: 50S ribosomal protein L9 [Candidatus Aerophobetes bacterium]
MQNQLLLLEDVGKLGRKGDIVTAKPGFVRNYLIPQKKAVVATPHTLKLRVKLQEERTKQAAEDKTEAEALAKVIEGRKLSTKAKVDPAGHMYGSVTATDIVNLFAKEGVELEKGFITLIHPIKTTGEHRVDLRLKEGVPTHIIIEIIGEGERKSVRKEAAKKTKKKEETEEKSEETKEKESKESGEKE